MKVRIRRHYISLSLLLLAALEGLVVFGSVYLAANIRFIGGMHEGLIYLGPLYLRASVIMVIMMTIMIVFGLYEPRNRRISRGYIMLLMSGFALGFVLLTVLFYLFPSIWLGRGVFGLSMLLSFVGLIVVRAIYNTLLGGENVKKKILVLGTGSRSAPIDELENALEKHDRFKVVGYVKGHSIDFDISSNKLFEPDIPLLALAQKNQADEIVVGVRQRRGGGLNMRELLECRMEGIPVIGLSSFYEREMGRVLLDSLNPSWFIYGDGFDRGSFRNATKRIFDFATSLIILVITLPVMLITAFSIKLESRGPIFYSQRRVGECGHLFNVLKFRSMRVDAEKHGAQWAQKNDPRITRIGRVIRLLRIDELPQIINVLRGDMSFVGPRPERPEFIEKLAKQIPHYASRHSVKPGITGWAQVKYPYGASLEDARNKLEYDLYYAKNHTLFLDLIILFQTAQVVLFGKGAR